MTQGAVAALLATFPTLRWGSGPYGFTCDGTYLAGNEVHRQPMRIERGSGIAGRGNHWAVVDIPTGTRTKLVATKRELRRFVIEWLAGPPPPPIPGRKHHAKLGHNRFGDAYIWVTRHG